MWILGITSWWDNTSIARWQHGSAITENRFSEKNVEKLWGSGDGLRGGGSVQELCMLGKVPKHTFYAQVYPHKMARKVRRARARACNESDRKGAKRSGETLYKVAEKRQNGG